ncbi:MAG: hypothetical protein LZF86_110433 [Nitrospira sp.]|nr:MAG: hypothetical protein LZF86_110433 [Nitrospira sp.]
MGSLGVGAPPFMDLVGLRLISRMGTRTPEWAPLTWILREAGNGAVVNVAALLVVLWPFDPLVDVSDVPMGLSFLSSNG